MRIRLRELLATLDITGRVLMADALHTQQATARFLVEEMAAHYLLTVKDNQPTLVREIEDFIPLATFSSVTVRPHHLYRFPEPVQSAVFKWGKRRWRHGKERNSGVGMLKVGGKAGRARWLTARGTN